MSKEEVKQLPVQDIAEKNCSLIMWCPNPLLDKGLEVIKSWGFDYKTVLFCWVKTYPNSNKIKLGMGNYTRSNMELCLIGMKGSLPRINHSVYQVHISHVGKHSVKPPLFRDEIVKLFGDLPRIELFARQKADGWDSWGNEIENHSGISSTLNSMLQLEHLEIPEKGSSELGKSPE